MPLTDITPASLEAPNGANTTHAPLDQPVSAVQAQRTQRTSVLEKTFGAFYEATVAEARNDRHAKFNAGRLMTDLNQIKTTLTGLGVVMRIVSANCVNQDNFDPADPNSQPPLSPFAEGALTAMTASVCEMLAERIEDTADSYNREVQS